MFALLFFCVNLSILHLSVGDRGYQCTEDPAGLPLIHLLITYDPDNDYFNTDEYNHTRTNSYLNEVFNKRCGQIYKIIEKNINVHNALNETLQEIGKEATVVNLYVRDYYEHDDSNEVKEKLMYAGDLINTNQIIQCWDTKDNKRQCNASKIVKVISKSDVAKEIYDLVDSIKIIGEEVHARESCISVSEYAENLTTVLLCMDYIPNIPNIHVEPLKLRVEIRGECKKYIEVFQNFLAVLAPEPFEMDFEYSVPVVFYKTLYMSPESEQIFTNSMILPKWQRLTRVMLKFLNLVGWKRLAILSDDSFYSIEFENELAMLLNKEKIAYTVIHCKTTCDGKMKISLLNIGAKIVIANIEEKNAQMLLKNDKSGIVWLLRDKIEELQVYDTQQIFTFSLGASVKQSRNCGVNEHILDGLSSISLAYRFIKNKNLKMTKREYYREFLNVMKRSRPSECLAYVHKRNLWDYRHVSKMRVKNDEVEVISFEDPYKGGHKPEDVSGDCFVRNSNFFNSCEDSLVLLFMLIVIMFSTTVLMITFYFHKSSPFHDIRYQNF